ncbi:MAG: GAF domain-containing protein [Aquabacterium sp.]|nr:GAF domain-containing protein [Aquabacterium sp.]
MTARQHVFAGRIQTMLGEVWQHGQSTCFPQISEELDPQRGKQAVKEGLCTSHVIPIRSGDRVSYLLEFLSHGMAAPDGDMQAMLESLCAQVAQFIDRCRDELRVRQFMTEFDCLFKLSPDGFVVFNT